MLITSQTDLQGPQIDQTRRVYGLSDGTYVLTSAIVSAFDTGRAETFVFPCTQDGKVTDWGELPGSFSGSCDHERAIQGYLESRRNDGA